MSENELSVAQQNPIDDRPGHRLAEARKAKGLSLEEVASQLRLNVSMLQALENDDYSHLPPAAYVSGYVRSYARALGLSEAEVLRSSNAAPATGEPPIVGVVARSHTAQVQANDPRVRMLTIFIFGGLLAVSGLWWIAQREEPAPMPAAETALPPAPEAATPAEGTALAPAAATAPAVAPMAGAPAAAAPVIPAPAAAAAAPARPAAITPPAATKPASAPASTPAAPSTAIAANAAAKPPAAEAQPKPETPPPPPLTADMPQSKVALEFTADCWVDVVDSAGRQLAYELAPAGRKLKLRGEAPFTVFFGFSPGVRVSFNDQAFDHRPFQRKDVARFKLGTPEDNIQSTEAQ